MILLYFLILPFVAVCVAPFLKPRVATYLTTSLFMLPFFAILSYISYGCAEIPLTTFSPPIGEIYLNADFIAHAFGLTICIVTAMVALFALPYMRRRFEELELSLESAFKRYIFLYDLCAASMLWLVYSGNLVLLYIFLEITLATTFLLIYFYGYANRRWVSQLYMIWCLIAGVLTLAGFLMVAINNDTLAFKDLTTVGKYAWPFIFVGMIIELPVVGPHIWLPWAYAEAPTPLNPLQSLTEGLAGYVLLRMVLVDYSFIMSYQSIILGYALFSSIYAGFSVFRQVDLKRLLAYSTVSQMGYMLVALCLGPFGLIGLVIQYMSHAFGKSILFSNAGGIITTYHGLRDIRQMGGLHDSIPAISNAATFGFMNLGGIMTIGMLGEFCILRGVIETFGISTGGLSVFLPVMLMFILSVWYGFYTIRKVFYGEPKDTKRLEISRYLYIPPFIIGIFSVLLLFPPLSTALIPGLGLSIGLKSVMGGVVP